MQDNYNVIKKISRKIFLSKRKILRDPYLTENEIFGVLCLCGLDTLFENAQMFFQILQSLVYILNSYGFCNQSMVVADPLICIQHQG